MAEIKNCPFCGSKAEIHSKEYMVKIRCSNDDCLCCRIWWFDEIEEAVEDWNRRADNAEV